MSQYLNIVEGAIALLKLIYHVLLEEICSLVEICQVSLEDL